MDCSKTKIFLSEWQRMCDTVKYCMRCDIPVDSPTGASCIQFVRKYREEAMRIVQKWSDEHPMKTYADDFFAKFPHAWKNTDGTPVLCRKTLYGGCVCANGKGIKEHCEDLSETKYKCWNEPYTEEGETDGE